MLKEVSSKEQPLTQIAMCKTLNHIGIDCDRKTISRNIQYLKDYGYDIKHINRKGVYLYNNNKLTANDIADIIKVIQNSNLNIEKQTVLIIKLNLI